MCMFTIITGRKISCFAILLFALSVLITILYPGDQQIYHKITRILSSQT
jgi:hypothetical protein